VAAVIERVPTPLRRPLAAVAVIAVALLVTQVVLPGDPAAARGTPAAVLFQGLVLGLINSLVAAGIILVYRAVRIINFAQTALGVVGAYLFFELTRWTPVPFPVAFVLGVALAALTGVIVDLVFGRRFFNSPRLVLTVVTIVVARLVTGVADQIMRLPLFPPFDQRTQAEQSLPTAEVLRDALPFRGFDFRVGDLNIPFGFSHLFAIEIVVMSLLLLAAFFRYTRAGVGVRALAENPQRAALLGISVGGLSTVVWALSGALSGTGVILSGMVSAPGVAAGFAPDVLLPAMTAAVMARMRSLPVAVLASVVIAVLQGAFAHSYPDDATLIRVGLFVAITAALLVQRRLGGRSEGDGEQVWQAAEEPRPVPTELRSLGGIRLGRFALIAVALLFVGVYPFVASVTQVNLGGVIALQAIVALSVVVLTGWAGQMSLGQFGFMAVGTVVGGSLSERVGLPFWLAVPLASVVAGAVAVLVGIPALRIRGLFLAITTFAFAFAVHAALFEDRYFGWLLPNEVSRPSLFFLDFDDEKSMYFLCVASLVLAIVVVVNLRRSRLGRVLIAARENEANLQSFGVGLLRVKLTAFAVSGALAGFAGAVFAHQQRGVSQDSFQAAESVRIFVVSVLGGIGTPAGAILGSLYVNGFEYLVETPWVRAIFLEFGLLWLIWIAPGGFISLFTRIRDAVLRIVAQRRQLVVPSLFADLDPDALERRLIPLSEPHAGSGLDALPAGQTYRLESELYRRGRNGNGEGVPSREGAAIGAAAQRLEETP
jgi:branched-chain amino acid transport system permease protein